MKLILANKNGDIFVHPSLEALGSSAGHFWRPEEKSWIPMPKGSTFFYMPGHVAFGWDKSLESCVGVQTFGGKDVFPVAAFPVSGFTRTALPAAIKKDPRVMLPLWPYTAVGWGGGRFYIAAFQVDRSLRQRPYHYRRIEVMKNNMEQMTKEFPGNRILRHLTRCAQVYNCRNAQDLFLRRWEAPLPVSPSCNACCMGCLSFQGSDCAASHSRINFIPNSQEVADIALTHIRHARQALVSFGQGCEGEPLLQFKVIREAIERVRRVTRAGTIHLNTNGFNSRYIKELAVTGLDSVRISVNSLDPDRYATYYRPKNYDLNDVVRSFEQAKRSGLFVSMNLLVFPGITDSRQEVSRLVAFLKKGFVDLLQLRNLSIDPGLFAKCYGPIQKSDFLGMQKVMSILKNECPRLRLGYFNLPKERFV